MPLIVTAEFRIPDSEIVFSYARSSGPGGQNVNKVNSKAVLRWNLRQSASVPAPIRERIIQRLAGALTSEGDLVLTSERFRDQPRNREDCLEKLREMLLDAATPPKKRKKTRPTRSSQKRRLDSKAMNSRKKSFRKGNFD